MTPQEKDALRVRLIGEEAYRTVPYDDASGRPLKTGDTLRGKLTAGIGRNITDKAFRDSEIQLMFENDLEDVLEDLSRTFPWFSLLDSVRRTAIIDMCFELGLPRFEGFHDLIAAAARGDWNGAADAALASAYAHEVPTRAHRVAGELRTGAAA